MKEYAILALLAIAVALLVTYGCISQPPEVLIHPPPVSTNTTPGGNATNSTNATPGNSTQSNGTNTTSNGNVTSNGTGGPDQGTENGTIPVPPGNETPAITKQTCEQAHGHWNDCGSACRGAPPGMSCIEVCVQYCECGGIAGFGCPDGYKCTDYLPKDKEGNPVPDAMGICKINKTTR